MKYRNIVVIADAGIGDFIWATSALSLIRQYDKNIHITLVTSDKNVELIDDSLNINKVITTNDKYQLSKNKFIRLSYKLFWSIKNFHKFYNLDVCLFLDITLFFAVCAKYLYRIKNIIGPDNFSFGYNINNSSTKYYTQVIVMPKDSDRTSYMMRYQLLVRAIFPTYNLSLPILPATEYLRNKILSLIGKSKKYKIALAPYGSIKLRILDVNYLKDLIINISKNVDVTFFILGNSQKEKEYASRLKKVLSKDIDLRDMISRTTLLELKEFLKNMDLLISVDTGIVHLAANANVNTISIHGPTLPQNSMPISSKNISLCSYRKCSPCTLEIVNGKSFCQYPQCMADIKPEMVFEKVKEILKI